MHSYIKENIHTIGTLADGVIVRSSDGGPIRTIGTGNRRHRNGEFQSRKCGRAMPWQSPLELSVLRISEADPGVVTFLSQPHRLEIQIPGSTPLVYFPDIERRIADASVEVLEIKSARDRRWLADTNYQAKIEKAAEIYSRLNWRFAIVDEDELRSTPLTKICRHLVGARGIVIDPMMKHRVLTFVEQRLEGRRRSEIISILGTEPVAERILDGLVLERLLTFDFLSNDLRDPFYRLVRRNEPCFRIGTER